MTDFHILSPSQQVADHLRTELRVGRWSGTMPGSPALAAELGIDSKTVWAALTILEEEGLLAGQGTGRPRKIVMPADSKDTGSLRIAILEYEVASLKDDYMVDLRHKLTGAGYQVIQTTKTLTELGMKVPRIRSLVKDHLARRGFHSPDHVSLICRDPGQTFSWLRPSVAHVRWDHRPIVRRIVNWADNLNEGKKDVRQTLTKAEFVEGGTVGPAPR